MKTFIGVHLPKSFYDIDVVHIILPLLILLMLQNYTVTVRRGKIPIGMYWRADKYHSMR